MRKLKMKYFKKDPMAAARHRTGSFIPGLQIKSGDYI